MRIAPNQRQINDIKSIWQAIRWRMNAHRVTPAKLALRTGYSKDRIERGVRGEPEQLTSDFLRACVNVFGLTSGRAKFYEETDDILTVEECVRLIKPPPEMPPRQGNFWDYL